MEYLFGKILKEHSGMRSQDIIILEIIGETDKDIANELCMNQSEVSESLVNS